MTLGEAIERLRTRFAVDIDDEVDLSDDDIATAELIRAARTVSQDCYHLWTWQSELTLTLDDPDYDLLSADVSAVPVFHCYGVHVNGGWLSEVNPRTFMSGNPAYHDQDSTAHPAEYVLTQPSTLRLATPPNQAAVDADDNFVIGFHLHPPMTFATDEDNQLSGPDEYHDLYIDIAFLNASKSYISDGEQLTRRRMIQAEYRDKASRYKSQNLAIYKKEVRLPRMGRTRRIHTLGGHL